MRRDVGLDFPLEISKAMGANALRVLVSELSLLLAAVKLNSQV